MLRTLWKRPSGSKPLTTAPWVAVSDPESQTGGDKSTALLLASFTADLEASRFELTSMPEVAFRVRDMLADPGVEPAQLGEVINLDPAIAAKLMRTANSPLYLTTTPCDSIRSAVIRMGMDTTRQLVLCYTLRDLFRHDAPELKAAMATVWEHTVYVAAICYALAQRTGTFAPEQAMLAGMMSNVGVLSVFNYLGNHPDIYMDEKRLEATVKRLRGEVGTMVLERWEFSEEIVDCARYCQNWYRQGAEETADLCDLVLVATLHAVIGKQKIPQIDNVPAFRKVSAGKLGPEVAINFLREAKDEIAQAKSLISG